MRDVLSNRDEQRQEDFNALKRRFNKSYPSRNGLKIPEIMILYYARTFTTEQTDFQNFWYYRYAVDNPKAVLQMLWDKGFIFPAPAKESLGKFKVPELKEILRELNLKVSGSKNELLQRISENATDEFLSQRITNRVFELTPLGEQELKDNEYVGYFHNQIDWYLINQGIDIFWVNKQMHEHHNIKYRDLIWGELNKRSAETMKDVQNGRYGGYIFYRNIMAKFLMEEKNQLASALKLSAEAIYYQVNSSSYNEYLRLQTDYQRTLELKTGDLFDRESIIRLEPDIYSSFRIDTTIIRDIVDKLELSDNQLFQKLINTFDVFHASKQIISNEDLSGLVVSLINGSEENVENIYKQLHDTIKKEAEIKYKQEKRFEEENSVVNVQLANPRPRAAAHTGCVLPVIFVSFLIAFLIFGI